MIIFSDNSWRRLLSILSGRICPTTLEFVQVWTQKTISFPVSILNRFSQSIKIFEYCRSNNNSIIYKRTLFPAKLEYKFVVNVGNGSLVVAFSFLFVRMYFIN